MNIVLIPAYNRPEFLWHTCNHIADAEQSGDFHYIFLFDRGFDQRNYEAIMPMINHSTEVILTPPTKYQASKQSHNVLNGFRIAVERNPEMIFLIEDDVFIANDFFRWHLEIHKRGNWFAAIGTKNHNSIFSTTEDTAEWYESSEPDYQSLGVSFKAEVLRDLVLPHFNSQYLSNSIKYCMDKWPSSVIGRHYAEQDGLIRRILESSELKTVFPHVPRAYHAGFYGKNRGHKYRKKISLGERIADVYEHCYSWEGMNQVCEKPEWFMDSQPVPLTGNLWESLRD